MSMFYHSSHRAQTQEIVNKLQHAHAEGGWDAMQRAVDEHNAAARDQLSNAFDDMLTKMKAESAETAAFVAGVCTMSEADLKAAAADKSRLCYVVEKAEAAQAELDRRAEMSAAVSNCSHFGG